MMPGQEQLVAAGVSAALAGRWLGPVRVACVEFGIDTDLRIAAFLSQCAHESAGFTLLEENLNYRAATMATVWPKRFAQLGADGKPLKDAQGRNVPNKFALAIERQPEVIANVVYASRMGNGPTESGDGWRFRGRGLKQLTGRDNYARCGAALKIDLVSTPDDLLQPLLAARSAGWFWATNGCSAFADRGDVQGLTRRINGGLIGLSDRQARYARVLAAINNPVSA